MLSSRIIHDFWRAKQIITFSGRDHLYVTVLTDLIKGVHSFQPNCQKGPWHWKCWEPLI